MCGADIVDKLASVNIETYLQTFQPNQVSPLATQKSIDGATSLAAWFKKMYDISANADREVEAFRAKRSKMVIILPQPTITNAISLLGVGKAQAVNVLRMLEGILKGKDFLLRYACDPYNSEAEVNTRLFEMLVLVFMGFVSISGCRWGIVSFPQNDEKFVRAANRLSEWDDGLKMDQLRENVPVENGAESHLHQDNADQVCRALKAMLGGAAISVDQVL